MGCGTGAHGSFAAFEEDCKGKRELLRSAQDDRWLGDSARHDNNWGDRASGAGRCVRGLSRVQGNRCRCLSSLRQGRDGRVDRSVNWCGRDGLRGCAVNRLRLCLSEYRNRDAVVAWAWFL